VGQFETQEYALDQINARLVQLSMQDKICISEARLHRSSGSRVLFRTKMMEHRRIQVQLTQLQRFKDNAMLQFDALRNHELNQTFVRAMKGVVGANKGRISKTHDDAVAVIGELHESLAEVTELSEFLGQPVMPADEVDDEELEKELMDRVRESEEMGPDMMTAEPPTPSSATEFFIRDREERKVSLPQLAPYVDNRIVDRLDIRPMLPTF